MESLKYIDSEIGRQVALMKNSILSEQYKLANLVTGAVSSVTNNSKTVQYDGSNQFVIENLNLNTGQDVEQFFNEAEMLRLKKKPYQEGYLMKKTFVWNNKMAEDMNIKTISLPDIKLSTERKTETVIS